MMDEVV